MLDLNYILSTDNPLDTFRTLYSDVLVDKLNQMIKDCNDCGTSYEKQLYYGNSNANVMIINGTACSDKAINDYFNELIDISDLNKNDIFVVNSVSCITTRKDKDDIIQRIPAKKECNNCKCFLNQAIKIVNPRIIVSLGAVSLNQFIPGTNLLEYINTKQVFNGIPTLINYSVKDLFDLCAYKSDEEIQDISYSILNTLNEAAQYIKNITE
jgi:uracil-DNA glycosylase family 4